MGIKDEDVKLQLNSNGGLVKINTVAELIKGKNNLPLKFSERSKDFIDNLKRKFNHSSWVPLSKASSVNTTMFGGERDLIK
jgi:hypothetical protein